MTTTELYAKLAALDLHITWDANKEIASVNNPNFANPLLFFKPDDDEYTGSVQVKAINSTLFTGRQIAGALSLVNDFLSTPLDERGLDAA